MSSHPNLMQVMRRKLKQELDQHVRPRLAMAKHCVLQRISCSSYVLLGVQAGNRWSHGGM